MRAQEVFTTPLGPEKSTCGSWFVIKLFLSM